MMCSGLYCDCPRCMNDDILGYHEFELRQICRETLQKYIYSALTPTTVKQMEHELNLAIEKYGREVNCCFPWFSAINRPEDPSNLEFSPTTKLEGNFLIKG